MPLFADHIGLNGGFFSNPFDLPFPNPQDVSHFVHSSLVFIQAHVSEEIGSLHHPSVLRLFHS